MVSNDPLKHYNERNCVEWLNVKISLAVAGQGPRTPVLEKVEWVLVRSISPVSPYRFNATPDGVEAC